MQIHILSSETIQLEGETRNKVMAILDGVQSIFPSGTDRLRIECAGDVSVDILASPEKIEGIMARISLRLMDPDRRSSPIQICLALAVEGTGSAAWELEKATEKGIQELGNRATHERIPTEKAESLILSFKRS